MHQEKTAKVAGAMLLLASILALLLMFMHPEIHADNTAGALEEMVSKSSVGRMVHGMLIGMMAVFLFGFTAFAGSLRQQKILANSGLVFYACGTMGYVAAALLSGFVATGMAQRYSGSADPEAVGMVMGFGHLLNQAFANFAVAAIGLALLLWSLALLQRGNRWLALLGLVAALAPALALAVGLLRLDVTGMTTVIVFHMAWQAVIGWGLLRGHLQGEAGPQ